MSAANGNIILAGISGMMQVLPYIVQGVELLIDKITGKEDAKNEEEYNKRLREEMEHEIKELKKKQIQMSEESQKNTERIQDLEKSYNEAVDDLKRKEIEQEKLLLEFQQKEQDKKMEELKQKEEAIIKCRDSLARELSKGIFKIIRKFAEEERKWLENLNEPEIQKKISNLKQRLSVLFDELYEQQNIIEKLNNKFISGMKNLLDIKELNVMNFVIIGTSGVGKSTLINEVLGEMLAEEGMGKRITNISKQYTSKLVPFLTLLDTVGTEIGTGHKLENVLEETLKYIDDKLNNNDPNEHIHCILYCTTNNRFTQDELKVILKLREKYDGKKLPIVIVYTRATKDDEAEAVKKSINEFLNENGESLSDDIFGIKFIKVNAREEKQERFGEIVNYDNCFGLSTLMSTCFEKGEKAYRIAIKNSLIQISKNSILEYIDKIYSQLKDNPDYFSYLNQEFETNFSNYIAYCFEKITDVDNQELINNEELQDLHNYITEKNHEQNNIKEDPTKYVCMFCQKKTDDSRKCIFCGAVSCEECYLLQFEKKNIPTCYNCDQEIVQNSSSEQKIENNKIEYEQNEEVSKSIIYFNVLKHNLNIESRTAINNYINEFKKELIDIVKTKFDNFTKEAAKKLFTKILEKYIENINDNPNINLKESMKSKEELKTEVKEKLNVILKERAIENFMKKNSAELYQYIVEIFTNKLKNKIDEFIANLDKNNEVTKFFESCDILNEEKELKIKKHIDEYIKNLQEKEENSQHKSLILQFGDQMDIYSKINNSKQGEIGDSKINGESGNSKPLGELGDSKPEGETQDSKYDGETGETKEEENKINYSSEK